eukprot:CAMPEP_0197663880 /NCGR_PEP_ID=MMETSP1338-20131121/58294_1 /TAXON_ID=43686 ORGANISM="Pelagodinium beii, Strain RCC1491" /NCGR_SAMPLE_ID=MMETSP1338 /ASSEMBLY_ACC=CAM_ASM_000754 /LENGTH=554 /DNA_ID=CAMNT_0043242399 /DNA_START=172 /DNA_END=1833 /DNA_ORIENTATION=+
MTTIALDPGTADHVKKVVALYVTTGMACLLLPTPPVWDESVSLLVRSSCAGFAFFSMVAVQSQEYRRLLFLISTYCNAGFAIIISSIWTFGSFSLAFILVGNAFAIAFYLLLTIGPCGPVSHTIPVLVCSGLAYQFQGKFGLQTYSLHSRRLFELSNSTTDALEAEDKGPAYWFYAVPILLSLMLGAGFVLGLSSREVRAVLHSQLHAILECTRRRSSTAVMRLQGGEAQDPGFDNVLGQPSNEGSRGNAEPDYLPGTPHEEIMVQPAAPLTQDGSAGNIIEAQTQGPLASQPPSTPSQVGLPRSVSEGSLEGDIHLNGQIEDEFDVEDIEDDDAVIASFLSKDSGDSLFYSMDSNEQEQEEITVMSRSAQTHLSFQSGRGECTGCQLPPRPRLPFNGVWQVDPNSISDARLPQRFWAFCIIENDATDLKMGHLSVSGFESKGLGHHAISLTSATQQTLYVKTTADASVLQATTSKARADKHKFPIRYRRPVSHVVDKPASPSQSHKSVLEKNKMKHVTSEASQTPSEMWSRSLRTCRGKGHCCMLDQQCDVPE